MIKCLHGNSTTLARRAEQTQHSDCVPASAAVAAATAATSVACEHLKVQHSTVYKSGRRVMNPHAVVVIVKRIALACCFWSVESIIAMDK
jgi:protein-disulfide isomerase-like protein with CxxC motif